MGTCQRQARQMLKEFFSGPGRLTASAIFFYLATQEVSGIALLRSLAEALLLMVALHELVRGTPEWGKLVINPIYSSALLFVASALFACAISPLPAISFDEIKTPLLKGILLIPLLMSIAILGLVRHNWGAERIARLLLVSLAVSGLGQLIWVLAVYARHLIEADTLPADPYFHRYKVSSALAVFPFVLLSIQTSTRRWGLLMQGEVLGLLLVILTSNARGAWLGLFASVGYMYLVNRKSVNAGFKFDQKIVLLTPVLLGLVIFFLSGTVMIDTFIAKIAQGFDSGQRLGHGVWGATFDLILQQPWMGYGYGDAAYTAAYNALAPDRPEWFFRESIGAHNSILAHWVAAGVFGLIAVLILYAGFLFGARLLICRNSNAPVIKNLLHAGVAAMLALYLVRGQVETVRWDSYGMLMAIMLWLFALNQSRNRV